MNSSTESMSCVEAEPLLPLVADGAIDPDSDPALFAHLATCVTCQRLVAQHDLITLAIGHASPAPAPQARIIRLWPWAAAAALVVATGLYLATETTPAAPEPAPAVAMPPAAPAPAIAAEPSAPATEPDVIALRRGDGSTIYLVRHGEGWVAVDPAAMDGPGQPTHGGGSGVQVRY